MPRKSILITGCSSGIGYDAAHALRDAGWQVFASCRQEADCALLISEGFASPRIDYADPESIVLGLSEVLEATDGTLDALFNNGAFATPGAVEDLPRGALQEIFETNVFGVHELTTLVLPIMRAQGQGRIINCSSVLGLVTAPWRGAYVASKFALEGLTDSLRIEMRDTDIKVILIEPGPIATPFRKNSIPHFERWVDWENSARAAQYRDTLLKRLYEDDGPTPFELPAAAVSKVLMRALNARRPRARYAVTVPTRVMAFLRRILPVRMLDALLSRG
ncbi:SDR family NAD(P)-dependent oxidoreductase [Primorskyibacter flagellatus]|uniref:Short-chain dehydrogenase n=1 Tax=Primorskyibacter flagellatus TaxID=1387277 RepID=A0A1W2AZB4_9RHOB|nr:SDR family NAD(P)-dependent oxidoreductase [Primorskyibacter flagellatus]SMC66087.1 Short-chain dehydrogenase [Primorskyibacter flagellatus]